MCVCNALITVVCATGFSKAGLSITGTACLFTTLSAGLRHCEMFSSNTLSADRKGYKVGSTESPEYKP